MGDIDLSEYELCTDNKTLDVYLYHRAVCKRPWVIMEEGTDNMADLLEAIYDHIAEYHQ